MSEQSRWNQYSYSRLAAVAHADGWLTVSFEDGSQARIIAKQLLPSSTIGAYWDRLTFSPYEIAIPTSQDIIIIASSRVRALTDAEYDAHLARVAVERARRIGERIRSLRKARGLSLKDLTARAGISAASLARIEQGQPDADLGPLRQILAAMGCSYRDLAAVDEADVAPEPLPSQPTR